MFCLSASLCLQRFEEPSSSGIGRREFDQRGGIVHCTLEITSVSINRRQRNHDIAVIGVAPVGHLQTHEGAVYISRLL